MEILAFIRGLQWQERGSCEQMGFRTRLSLRRKSRKASLVSRVSATGSRWREGGLLVQEGGLLIQEGGDTGHWEGRERVRQGSLTREGSCWEGMKCVLNDSTRKPLN